jgi:hypothetical protein
VIVDNFFLHAESKATLSDERIIVGGENNGFTSAASRLSPAVVEKYREKSKEVNASYSRTAIMCRAFPVSYLS